MKLIKNIVTLLNYVKIVNKPLLLEEYPEVENNI